MLYYLSMHIVVFTGGILRDGKFVRRSLQAADMVIAADSGAKTALDFQTTPEVVIGDFDSLDKKTRTLLESKGCRFVVYGQEKDETDTELALQYALDNGATTISLLGGIEGDRIDHILANIFLLTATDVPIHCINGSTDAWVEQGPSNVTVTGQRGDLLSLLPLSAEVTAVTTGGLQYALRSEPLLSNKTRGISNVLSGEKATVRFRSGTLLLAHTSS